jgi:hypothetical protein
MLRKNKGSVPFIPLLLGVLRSSYPCAGIRAVNFAVSGAENIKI